MHDLPSQCKSEGSLGQGQTSEVNFGEGLVRRSVNRVFGQPVMRFGAPTFNDVRSDQTTTENQWRISGGSALVEGGGLLTNDFEMNVLEIHVRIFSSSTVK